MTTQTEQVLAECLALLLEERKATKRGISADNTAIAELLSELNEAQAEIANLKEELAATKHNLGRVSIAVMGDGAPIRSPVPDV